MNLIAIDPGTTESGVVEFLNGRVSNPAVWPNELLIERLSDGGADDRLCIEMIASYGMSVGREVFETCLWIGRFMQQWKIATGQNVTLVYRRDVKLHLCGTARAKDANIRQALIDRFGPPGTKKKPGKTYGMSGDMWAALAVAVYVSEAKTPA